MKKLLLGLGSVTAALTPVAAVISCANTGIEKTSHKFIPSDLIKKIKKGDKGFDVEINHKHYYISEKDGKNGTSFMANEGSQWEIPPLIVGKKGLIAKKTMTDAIFIKMQKQAKDGLISINPNASQKEIQKVMNKVQKTIMKSPISVGKPIVGQYVIAKHNIATNLEEVKKEIESWLTTIDGGNSLFKFAFKEASLKTNTPILTDVSKKAFEKIFTDLGIQLSNLVFEKIMIDKIEIIFIKSFDLVLITSIASTQLDLDKLKTALGKDLIMEVAGRLEISSPKVVKAKNITMTKEQLLTKINSFIKGGVGLVSLPVGVTDELIKDDMKITLVITKAKVPREQNGDKPINGEATLLIKASNLTTVTVKIAIPFN